MATRFADLAIRLGTETSILAGAVKPRLRGWLHAIVAPLALAASITLVALAPTTPGKISTAIFGLTAVILFGVSGVYHRGKWGPMVSGVLRILDHSNIFLLIAGTYTPLAVLLLPRPTATLVLSIVWGGAAIAILSRFLWRGAPRWFYVPIYVALGWVAVWFLPELGRNGGTAVVWLIIAGGIAYTVGAAIFAFKWPDPSPAWFGYHEIFHILTVIGFACHCVAIYLAALAA